MKKIDAITNQKTTGESMKEGDFVLVHLTGPTERFWGRLLRLFEAGVVLRGIEVGQIEVFKYQFHDSERTVFPQTFFFPLRRVQKIDLDEAMDSLPSVIHAIKQISGLDEDSIMR